MKWNKRLKTVLTTPAKSGFSADCLETELRITANTPESLVSAVIRSDEFRHFPENLTNSDASEKESNLVSAVIRSGHSRQSFKTSDDLAQFKTDKLHEVLNRFIAGGITFDVSADDFLFVDTAQTLKLSDMEFLKLNGAAILCQLQQSLLMKHLFNHSPEQFEDFAFEVREREAIFSEDSLETTLTITDKTPFKIYCEAVKSTTRKWFVELLKEN